MVRERFIAPEMLDVAPPEVARENLRDLVRLNRYFGGYRILRTIIGQMVDRGDSFSVLDIGAASGDMGAALQCSFPQARVTSLDRRQCHIETAAAPRLLGDAFHLPFRPASFDFVFSSLFLHHFTDHQVVDLLRSFKTVARRAVLAIDLDRGPLSYHFLPATRWLLGWHPITLNDGPISVQAGFKRQELQALAERAGFEHPQVRTHRPWGRLSLVAPFHRAGADNVK